MTARATALEVAWHYLGSPYIWAGDDPVGFDCSGLVVEALKSVGALPRVGDWTAHDLRLGCDPIGAEEVQPGDLVFWLTPDTGQASHVGLCLGNGLYLGAEGGGPWATDPVKALKGNAYVQVRPIASRGSEATRRYGRPLYPED